MLDRVASPRDLRRLSDDDLDELAQEIRTALVDAVSRTGGHLGPNLGVVELTIAFSDGADADLGPLLTG